MTSNHIELESDNAVQSASNDGGERPALHTMLSQPVARPSNLIIVVAFLTVFVSIAMISYVFYNAFRRMS